VSSKNKGSNLRPEHHEFTLTELELSQRWKLDPRTLRNWRCQGRGPRFFKIGACVRYPVSEIEAYEMAAMGGAA